MKIRSTLVGNAALLATFLVPWIASAQAESKPNILWIVTDDQRPDSVSAYNRLVYGKDASPLGYVESPNIDKLAAEGVMFTRAMCNSPACGPSRGSMHSGRYPFRNGHYAFELTHQAPDFVRPVVPQILRDHGYSTASFGKDDSYIEEFVFATDPADPRFPTAEQKPHPITLRDAQGEYLGLAFQRRKDLGPDYAFIVEGQRAHGEWTTLGVMQQHSVRSLDGQSEQVRAQVAATRQRSRIDTLRLRVEKPKPRPPRKWESMFETARPER